MTGGPTCSALSAAADEHLIGSAPRAATWLALEQPGPWGARAFTQSHLDPDVGAEIERRATAAGVRPCLIRTPGRHADHHTGPREVLVGHSRPGGTWLVRGSVADPAVVLDLDWDALAAGESASALDVLDGVLTHQAHLLVCTNGTRDLCCAALGRPVALAGAAAYPGRVWESTHTSGHRFAPTAVLLPAGTLHGRLDGPEAAASLLAAADAGRLVLAGYRGRSTWGAAAQVAEAAVREAEGLLGLDDVLDVRVTEDEATVRLADGTIRGVLLRRVATGRERPESCGKAAVELHRWVAQTVPAV